MFSKKIGVEVPSDYFGRNHTKKFLTFHQESFSREKCSIQRSEIFLPRNCPCYVKSCRAISMWGVTAIR